MSAGKPGRGMLLNSQAMPFERKETASEHHLIQAFEAIKLDAIVPIDMQQGSALRHSLGVRSRQP